MDIHTVLQNHQKKSKNYELGRPQERPKKKTPTTSEIPDLFFDDVLSEYKLSRVEIIVLMYLYRSVWCRPNLHKEYGISPEVSYEAMTHELHLSTDEIFSALLKLENFSFIRTIRPGQFFVRKYFTEKCDGLYEIDYDKF